MAQLVKTFNALAIASVKTLNGLAIASAKTINGLDNTSGGGATSFLTSQTTSTLRHDFTGELGFRFDVGASPISVLTLGRWIAPGNSQSHDLRICDTSGNTIISATLNTSGLSSGAYAYVSATGTLSASTTYFCFSSESIVGGDDWYDEGSVSSTAVGSVTGSGFAVIPGNPMMANAGTLSFVPPNFQY